MLKYLIILAALFCASITQAEVTNTAANGFSVRHEVAIPASRAEIWKALVAPATWWSSEHSFSGDAKNLYLVPQAGGCFCELIRTKSDDNIKSAQGSVQHMRVIFVRKERALRMSGALGPLQGEAVTGILTIELKSHELEAKSLVSFTYKVGGYMELPVNEIAPAVDGMIGEQLERLKELFIPDDTPAEDTASGLADEDN